MEKNEQIEDINLFQKENNTENKPNWEDCEYRIRKLTSRECYRLMGVREDDINKMQNINSATQCYKQAGNSIVVSVLMAIFSQLNLKGVTPWNDLTDEQKYELIDSGCFVNDI